MFTPHEELGLRVLRTFHQNDPVAAGEKEKEKDSKDSKGPSPGLYVVYLALLQYKFIEYRILARILGLSDDRGTITGRDSKGEIKIKKLLEELCALKMVGRQERKDPREKSKTTGERKDVQDYLYYYVDFRRQLMIVKFRLHMMRKAVEEKLRLGEEASAEATADEIGRDGTPYAWLCPHCELVEPIALAPSMTSKRRPSRRPFFSYTSSLAVSEMEWPWASMPSLSAAIHLDGFNPACGRSFKPCGRA